MSMRNFQTTLKERLPLIDPTVIVITGSREWGGIEILRDVARHIKDHQDNVVGLFHGGHGSVEKEFHFPLMGCRFPVYEIPRSRDMLEAAQNFAEHHGAAIRLLAFPMPSCIERAQARGIPVSVFSQNNYDPGPYDPGPYRPGLTRG